MADYWRPGYKEGYKEKLENFLEDNPELPFENPRELMKFCTDRFVTEVELNQEEMSRARKKLDELRDELMEE